MLEVNHFLPAFWALGAEHQPYALIGSPMVNILLSLFLTILMVAGFITLLRQRRLTLIFSIILTIIGAVIYIVIQQYGYGAYKILSVGWWRSMPGDVV